VTVPGFFLDRDLVTNAQFARFVAETGHVTLAQRPPDPRKYPDASPERLAPGSAVFRQPAVAVELRDVYAWWTYVAGASWRHPQGPGSSLEGLADHPVVHVAYEDALAFARWAGKELPTEAEWERASRGGLDGADYVWGAEMKPGGRVLANTWQGEFPWQRDEGAPATWTTPVGTYPPNGYGLRDMAGNVWEWTSDLFRPHHGRERGCCARLDAEASIPRRVIKGGSFLCSPSYCHRFRPAARIGQPVDTSTCHLGFRCVVRPRG
jgi:sulfatase modifying factor 1